MIASAYIKDGNIHIYNENREYTNLGGLAYELGRPLLDFICYEPERFDESFTMIAEAFDDEFAYVGVRQPEFISGLKQMMSELQKSEIYVFFYGQMFMEFVYTFIDSPRQAIMNLEDRIEGAAEKLKWTMDFKWPVPPQGKLYADKERRLYRAALDAIRLMSEHLELAQSAMIHEIEWLITVREKW